MRLPAAIIAAVVLACSAGPASAQAIKLDFDNGRVTLKAENVTIRAILAEWARRGGTRMVNAERVAGSPVTLELAGVPEQQAIEILLRGVAGYMIGWRETGPEVPTASAFDRLMLLPTSTVVRTTAPPPAPPPLRQPVASRNDDFDDENRDNAVIGTGVSPRAREREPEREPEDDEVEPPAPTGPTTRPFGGNVPTTSRPGVIVPPPQQPRRAGQNDTP